MIPLLPVSLPSASSVPSTISIPVQHIAQVPFYSQFADIQSATWQKVGCGVTSMAMVINFYTPKEVTVNSLLKEAVAAGAYDKNAGWKHNDLIAVAKGHGLSGTDYDLSGKSSASAFATLSSYATDGPVIVSVHYKFDPKNPIPHMVVIDGISNGVVYYNDPAAKGGQKQISADDFRKAWKQKLIVMRPTKTSVA
jgi:ABC-type bacteriocin/lantibiotic exporter with double-glycine peptidase domain